MVENTIFINEPSNNSGGPYINMNGIMNATDPNRIAYNPVIVGLELANPLAAKEAIPTGGVINDKVP
jgi:hypothetical protein